MSLLRIADYLSEPKEARQRALTLLKTLDSQGRLDPVDRPRLEQLDKLLAESQSQDPP